ncbi:RNA 2',3'-cyclic phosphodiesterase [Salinarchaeum chitinilyticum]
MRLFVSVDLPDELSAAVAEVQAAFEDASGVRPTDPGQAHVTLKFLGDVPRSSADGADDGPDLDATIEAVRRGVEAADVEPFEASVEGLGAFPSPEYINVLWLGFGDGTAELATLHEHVEEQTVGIGFDPEDHEFTPHVTIGRMDHAGGKELVQEVLAERSPNVGSFRVEEVRLTESTLGPDGPVYETVESFEL